jgi:hypothetical protein
VIFDEFGIPMKFLLRWLFHYIAPSQTFCGEKVEKGMEVDDQK